MRRLLLCGYQSLSWEDEQLLTVDKTLKSQMQGKCQYLNLVNDLMNLWCIGVFDVAGSDVDRCPEHV